MRELSPLATNSEYVIAKADESRLTKKCTRVGQSGGLTMENLSSRPGDFRRSSAKLINRDFSRAVADVKVESQQQSDTKQWILPIVCNHF